MSAADFSWLARHYEAIARSPSTAESERAKFITYAKECLAASALSTAPAPPPEPTERPSYRRA